MSDGYIFDGWYNGETKVTEIPTGSTGNIVLTAKWTPVVYTIIYEGIKDAVNPNATEYTIESETIKLSDIVSDGYIFDGWYNGETKVTEIPAGSMGNIVLTAKLETIEYTATFKNGYDVVGTVKFTVETDTLSEPDVPKRPGYTSAWENYSLGAGDITINVVYTPITYTIAYENTKGAINPNVVGYTIESKTIKLSDIVVDDYIFEGWYNGETKVTEIPAGSIGNIVLTAKWTPVFSTIISGNTVTLVEYRGTAVNVVIPDGITVIASTAFQNNTAIRSVSIPNSVTRIEKGAFSGCSSLSSITLPFVGESLNGTSNTHFGYIFGASSYSDNVGCVPSALKTVVITGDTSIGSSAFYGCSNLRSITASDSVRSIGESAFQGCRSLSSVVVPDSVTSIGFGALKGCNNLSSITLPFVGERLNGTSNTHFGYIFGASAYSSNSSSVPSSLKTVVITGGSSIGASAFYGCSNLTNVIIGNSVTSIGKSAFYGCSSLNSITLPFIGDSLNGTSDTHFGYIFGDGIGVNEYVPNSLRTVVITGMSNIGTGAFYDCSNLTNVIIGNNVMSIGYQAFDGCSNLTNITIGNRVTSIGSQAFYNCCNLSSITIPNSVKSIGSEAFFLCSSLESITVPDSVTSIGYAAFSKCSSLKSITLPFVGGSLNGTSNTNFGYIFGTRTYYGQNTYIPSSLQTVVITGGTSISKAAFYNCGNLKSITLPDSVTSIGEDAFQDCVSLESITLGNKLTSIGEWMFYDCRSLKSITIPDGVKSIGKQAFSGCSSLESITIPDSVTSIGYSAFDSCSSLRSITIPNSVTNIDKSIFSYCSSLKSVTFGNGVTSISSDTFYKCSSLESITIPDSVRSIGSSAFSYCSNLTRITFNGTMAQWNTISKGSNWNRDTGNYTIHCTDGNIYK